MFSIFLTSSCTSIFSSPSGADRPEVKNPRSSFGEVFSCCPPTSGVLPGSMSISTLPAYNKIEKFKSKLIKKKEFVIFKMLFTKSLYKETCFDKFVFRTMKLTFRCQSQLMEFKSGLIRTLGISQGIKEMPQINCALTLTAHYFQRRNQFNYPESCPKYYVINLRSN